MIVQTTNEILNRQFVREHAHCDITRIKSREGLPLNLDHVGVMVFEGRHSGIGFTSFYMVKKSAMMASNHISRNQMMNTSHYYRAYEKQRSHGEVKDTVLRQSGDSDMEFGVQSSVSVSWHGLLFHCIKHGLECV